MSKLLYGIILLNLTNIADIISTYVAINQFGCYEANPVMEWTINQGWMAFIAAKLITVVAISTYIYFLFAKKHPYLAHAVICMGILLYATITINNIYHCI